jgi:chromosome segregation ATPase
MTNGPDDSPTTEKPEIEEIEAQIAHTREELAGTVDELTARLDVKARAKDRIQQTREQTMARVQTLRASATDDEGRPTPTALGAGGVVAATVAVVLALVLWRRRRR